MPRAKFCLSAPEGDKWRKVCELVANIEGLNKSLAPAMYRVRVPRSTGVQVGWRFIGPAKTLTISAVTDTDNPAEVAITCSMPDG